MLVKNAEIKIFSLHFTFQNWDWDDDPGSTIIHQKEAMPQTQAGRNHVDFIQACWNSSFNMSQSIAFSAHEESTVFLFSYSLYQVTKVENQFDDKTMLNTYYVTFQNICNWFILHIL